MADLIALKNVIENAFIYIQKKLKKMRKKA